MAIEKYPRTELYPVKELLLKKRDALYDNLAGYVKKDGVVYPVNAAYVAKYLTMEAPEEEIEKFSGEINEYFNLSPWGYYSDDTSYCVVHGKPGDVIEISMLFAHTELSRYVTTVIDLDGSETEYPSQEYVYSYINPEMWYYEDYGDGDTSFEAPAWGTGTPYTYIDSWNRVSKSIGNVYTGFAATARDSMWVDQSAYNFGHQMGGYRQTSGYDRVNMKEQCISEPKKIYKMTASFTITGRGGFDEFLAIDTDLTNWDANLRTTDYILGVSATMGANIIRPYDYTNKTKDTVLWIYETTAMYNGIPIENANTNPFAYAGRLNIKPSGIANDTTIAVGTNQRGSRVISENYKYAPWERYPEL